jgi:UDP-glucuronate 4-epimerase
VAFENRVVVTGAAGFIGMHLIEKLLRQGVSVVGVDNFQPAYGGSLCKQRSEYLKSSFGFEVKELDLTNSHAVSTFGKLIENVDSVIHLAAWPGVRQSQVSPYRYSLANIVAFTNVLEAVKNSRPKQFMFASSSSVYGDLGNGGAVNEELAHGNNVRSYYASTKWANEILARQYNTITEIPTIALRFFTVYGEFGRPDMAYWTFLQRLIADSTIELYGENGGKRNFTYVKDCVEAVARLVHVKITGYLALNIAAGSPVETKSLLECLSATLGKEPKTEVVDRPSVDVTSTWADLTRLHSLVGEIEPTPMFSAISDFVHWYRSTQTN